MKEKRKKKNKGNGSYSEAVRDTWFCWGFKLGFLQLICKANLTFKWNLELAYQLSSRKEKYMSQSMLRSSVDV